MKRKEDSKLGIFEETDQLKKVVIWGLVGVEAELAQMYPLEISLFLNKLDVLKARKEAAYFAKVLKDLGVEVIQARDELANNLKPQFLKKEDVISAIFKRVDYLKNKYNINLNKGWEKRVVYLIEEDIIRYGEKKALALNKMLSIDCKLSLGNLLFARDQANVLLNKMICSSMRKPARKPEVEIYKNIYKNDLKLSGDMISLPKDFCFEGGDA